MKAVENDKPGCERERAREEQHTRVPAAAAASYAVVCFAPGGNTIYMGNNN